MNLKDMCMAWDSTMRIGEKKSEKDLAHIAYCRFESNDTKDGTKYSLGGLYVRQHVTLVSKDALDRIRDCDPSAVVPGKGVLYKKINIRNMKVTREHVIPVEALFQHLKEKFEKKTLTERYIRGLMPKLQLALITPEQNKVLNDAGYNRCMPKSWKWSTDDILMRYWHAGFTDSIWAKV